MAAGEGRGRATYGGTGGFDIDRADAVDVALERRVAALLPASYDAG